MSSYLEYIYLVLIVATLFFLILTLKIAYQSRQNYAYQYAACVFLLFCIIHHFFLLGVGITAGNNTFLYDAEPFFLLYGPFLYVVLKTYDSQEIGKVRWLEYKNHFIIGGLFFISFFSVFIFYTQLSARSIEIYDAIVFNVIAVQFFGYSLFLYSKSSALKMYKRLKLIVLKVVIIFILLGFVYLGFILVESNSQIEEFILSFLVFVLFAMIYRLYAKSRSPEIVAREKSINIAKYTSTEEVKKYAKSSISEAEFAAYKEEVDLFVVTKKRFLLPEYSLEKLAEDTNINKHHISQLFSKVHQSSFSKFINQQRVEHSLKILSQKPNITIAELGTECGFNSRTSFFRAFKEVMGVSPSEFISNSK